MTTLADKIAASAERRGVKACPTCGLRHAGAARTPDHGWHDDAAPDAMTRCNACEWATADPDSAAGYCAACERDARTATRKDATR